MRLKNDLTKRIISFILAAILILNPFLTTIAFADDLTSTSDNTASATTDQTTTVENNNTATVDNNTNATSNTGDNTIQPQATPSPGAQDNTNQNNPSDAQNINNLFPSPTPTPSAIPEASVDPSTTDVLASPSPIDIDPSIATQSADVINSLTPDSSSSANTATDSSSVIVTNDNNAQVDNNISGNSQTGDNQSQHGSITTGDANTGVSTSNIVNTNITGQDFLYSLINILSSTNTDINLTELNNLLLQNPELVSAIASNIDTGDASVNLALANLLSQFAVYNNNSAVLNNNINLTANTGDNATGGKGSSINTGSASANLNLFNMANTNLTGSDWLFTVINIFKSLNGNIILPNEMDILMRDLNNNTATAVNQNTGDNSTNNATASSTLQTDITNNNTANVNNNVNVLANSGDNTINGSGAINTGSANAAINLSNIVNTNITGSRWVLLVIQNFGQWTGEVIGWWGNILKIGNTTLIWGQLPEIASADNNQNASAVNSNTGDGSTNNAMSSVITSTTVTNQNQATVNNNINICADTGNNQIDGKKADITTGDAQASANIANIVNTNIFGSHWFLGFINIFDNFIGNIIFGKPDLIISKSADRNNVNPGENLNYTINFANQGNAPADNVVITDPLPSAVTYISSSNNGRWDGSKVIWNIGRLNPGASGSVTVVVKINDGTAGQTITNTVNITTGSQEPNGGNNSGSTSTNVSSGGNGGGGGGGTGGTSGGGSSSNVCSDAAPQSAPRLLSAVPGANSVTLTWEKATDPVTYYLVAYGRNPGVWEYGNSNIGDRNTTSYTINNLSGGVTYYFVVRAGNGCMPGPYSNELSAVPGGGVVLGTGEGFSANVLGATSDDPPVEATVSSDVIGANTKTDDNKPVCWWWLILTLITALVTTAAYITWGDERPKRWWLLPLLLTVGAFTGDHYLAHQFVTASKLCEWMPLWSVLGSGVPTILFSKFKFNS